MNLRILVTGGAGFIGSALVRRLIRSTDAQVLNLDKLTYAASLGSLEEASASPRYRLWEGDVADSAVVARAYAEFRPHQVFHLAAESHVDRSIDAPAEFIRTNIHGTFTLLQEGLRYFRSLEPADQATFRFLHISTDEVFGSLGPNGVFVENTPYDPSSPYSASKAASDHLVRAWNRTFGLPTLVTNCSNNYGPFQFPEKLIPLMILKGLSGQPLPVYGSGQQIRDWLFVEDHVTALQVVMERGRIGQTYNIGGESERTNLSVVQLICELLDRLSPGPAPRRQQITHVPDRPGHDLRYAMGIQKIREELGWAPSETFESGLERTVRWYLEHREWTAQIADRNYGGQRLGLGQSR